MDKRLEAFQRLLDIMDELREKCPWDSVQTFETLRCLTIEETFELSEAIVGKDYPDMCKELGDLMLHIVFYAKIASETKLFDISDVINQLCDKLIRRHPHIYGEVKADKEGTAELTIPEGCSRLFFVVMGAPTTHWQHPWDLSRDASSWKQNNEQWPYRVQFDETRPM